MNKIWILAISFFLIFPLLVAAQPGMQDLSEFCKKISWFGQSTIRIKTDSLTIYLDPFRIQQAEAADIILITHDHHDHFDPPSIAKLATDRTIIVMPSSCRESYQEIKVKNIRYLSPGEITNIGKIAVKAVPAYNIKKAKYHPKSKNYLGYVLNIGGIRIYHAGDTERIPEMKKFQCDIACLPLGQTYTMSSVQEAADAALDVKARIAIPIHYGLYEGSNEDAVKFRELLKDKVKVLILPLASH
jgi:L-ascorbate metabolism protein UlaG (beta-lactamase superfamily)